MTTHSEDKSLMQHALQLAQYQLGTTAPNPAVGCVIVKEGAIVGVGATAASGRPHAETIALAMAGNKSKGATLYVTLEPCAHTGNTPPCTQAIIDAGITRVVVACTDPDPRVKGSGIAALRAASIEITAGVCETEAWELNEGFFLKILHNRPLITLKMATSLDGKIGNAAGESRWVTGENAREYAHLLRANHDAIATGIGTVLSDDPMLNCRIAGREDNSPIRVVIDSQLRLPIQSHLVQTAKELPVWVITTNDAAAAPQAKALTDLGVGLIPCADDRNHMDLSEALTKLAEKGVTRLLVEAGPQLSTSMLNANLVDVLYWFRAPIIIGEEGRAAISWMPEKPLADLPRFTPIDAISLGGDRCDVYRIRPCLPVSSAI